MQISKINNINFGYNKKINDKYQSLVKRDLNLEHAEKATLLGTISSSMKLEDRIVKLEGTGYSQIADNQKSINMLASLLIQQKTFLCYWADRLYPDMNYPQIECSEYNCQIPEIETKEMPEGLKNAYFWRKDLIKQVAQEVPNLDISDENINDFEKGAIIVNSEDKSSVIEPFVPHSFSPKSLDDVVGLKSQIQDIKDLIVLPLTNPEEAQNLKDNWGVDIPHFILFYGPPGCGKTMSAEAIKAQTDCTMYKFDIS
ncbi:AAA family ATPase, partial [bacterium]|nr:AAA family ATPase [bacterium]